MDRFAAMRVFIAVADAGSLSAAGRRLEHAARDRQPAFGRA